MDVDALGKGGKNYGGGKAPGFKGGQGGKNLGGKAGGKAAGGKGDAGGKAGVVPCAKGGKTNHKTADCKYFDGVCNQCGKHGHKRADCRQNPNRQVAVTESGSGSSSAHPKAQPAKPQTVDANGKVIEAIFTEDVDEAEWIFMVTESAEEVPECEMNALEFIVDSGAEASVVSSQSATSLGLVPNLAAQSLYNVSGKPIPTLGSTTVEGAMEDSLNDDVFWGQFMVAIADRDGVKRNVLSVARIVDGGGEVTFRKSGGEIAKNSRLVLLERRRGLFVLKVAQPRTRIASPSKSQRRRHLVAAEEMDEDEEPGVQPFIYDVDGGGGSSLLHLGLNQDGSIYGRSRTWRTHSSLATAVSLSTMTPCWTSLGSWTSSVVNRCRTGGRQKLARNPHLRHHQSGSVFYMSLPIAHGSLGASTA